MNNPLKMNFALRVKELRERTGLTQEEFALKINMDRSYYASIEVGRRNVTLASLNKIANGHGMTISELLEGIPPYFPEPDSEDEQDVDADS